jgi:hypothetical protein
MEPDKKGKTLWEMLMDRVHGSGTGNGNGAGIPFNNPLDQRVGSAVPIAFANGPEFAGYDFTVQEIREYTRRIGGQDFRFTDYVLRGVNTKSFDADNTMIARLRAVPNSAGANDSLLLRVYDEFGFAENFLAVLKDTTGLLHVTDDKTGVEDTFSRINDLRESYEAVVLVVSETTPDGKAATGKATPMKLEYWDYWRDADIGGGKTAKEFIFAEMNSDTGWFQLWRGREFFS